MSTDDAHAREHLAHLHDLGETLHHSPPPPLPLTSEEALRRELNASQQYATVLRAELDAALEAARTAQRPDAIVPSPSEWTKSPEWEALRQACFTYYGRRCAICNNDGPLHAHHRTYERYGGGEHETDIIALCAGCHELFTRLGRLASGGWNETTQERYGLE
jgi:hypothetical protein